MSDAALAVLYARVQCANQQGPEFRMAAFGHQEAKPTMIGRTSWRSFGPLRNAGRCTATRDTERRWKNIYAGLKPRVVP